MYSYRDSGFDPNIAINYHIAFLHLRDELAAEMERHSGLTKAAVKAIGQVITEKMRQNKAHMRSNKTWVDDRPLLDGRYRYTCMGHSGTHDIAADTLEHYKRMAMHDVSTWLKQLWDETK